MTENDITFHLKNAEGCLWRVPSSLRISALHHLAFCGLSGIEYLFPNVFVERYNRKKSQDIPQDIVSIFVDWLVGYLKEGQRPNFDLSNEAVEAAVRGGTPRVLLVSPIYSREETSIGLVRIAYFLRGLGIQADWVVATDNRLDQVVEKCLLGHYDIIGQGTTHYTFRKDIELIHRMAATSPNSLYILGGHGAVLSPEQRADLLNSTPISVIVRGFGERSTARLALRYMPKSSFGTTLQLEQIPGIYFINSKGHITETGVDDYNEEEFRALHAVFDASVYPVEEGILRLITSSHCPFTCVFCSSRNFPEQNAVRLQPNDILHIVRQIRAVRPDLHTIEFNDDNFSLNCRNGNRYQKGVDWLKDLCRKTSKTDFENVSTCCFSRADTIDADTLELLTRKLNLRKIGFGLEHVNPGILKQMKKGTDVKRVVTRIRESIRLGIDTNFFVILFSKWESPQSLLELIAISGQLCLEGAHVVYNFGLQPLGGADVSNDSTNSYIKEDYHVGDFRATYRAKIIPDNSFVGKWFKLMNTEPKNFFELQDELTSELLGDLYTEDIYSESLWFQQVLKPHENINRSNTLMNLIRFYSMFVFGQRFVDQDSSYFEEGRALTLAAVINYVFNGPCYRAGGVISVESKVEFLRRMLSRELAEDPLGDQLIELEVVEAGLKTPEIAGVHLGVIHHKAWARKHLNQWHAMLDEDFSRNPDRATRRRVLRLVHEIESVLSEIDNQGKQLCKSY